MSKLQRNPIKRYGATRRLQAVKVACLHDPQGRCLCGFDAYHIVKTEKGIHIICDGCQARRMTTAGPKRTHDSILEWTRSEVLLLLQGEGAISSLTFHPTVTPFPGNRSGYTADAMYAEDGRWIYEDIKGIKDREWTRTVALWQGVGCEYQAPGVLREVTQGKTRLWVVKDYKPRGAIRVCKACRHWEADECFSTENPDSGPGAKASDSCEWWSAESKGDE